VNIADLLVGSGIGGILLAIVQAVVQRRKLGADTAKTDADATSVLTAAAVALVAPLNAQIKGLEEQLDRVKTKTNELEAQLDASHARESAKDALIAELTRGGSAR